MTNVFDETPPQTEARFEDLVGEGKKYRDQEAAAKALVEKDLFIQRLQQEAAEAREAAMKRMSEEEFLSKLAEVARPKSPDSQEPPAVARDPQDSGVKPEDVERIIEAREAKRQREANLQEAISKLQETFGDDYRSRVQSQAKAMGVGTEFLTDVASKNPQAFYRLMEMGTKEQRDPFSPPPRTQVLSNTNQNSGRKDYAYFQKLRQEKGEGVYFSVPVQQEIWKAAREAEARGESFFPMKP